MNEIRLLAPLAALALAVAGCGSSSSKPKAAAAPAPATTATTPAATATATATTSAPAAGGAVAVSNATDTAHKPKLGTPKGAPPATLVKKDLVVGHGPAAKAGDLVSVQYVGISWSTGKQFDASWDRGQPFSFPLGQSQVIQGWDQGVPGMKVGGRRELVIPPDLGYGAQGAGADIRPNETLVFVVDLKRIG
jgi:peptidylprolyl isomerase